MQNYCRVAVARLRERQRQSIFHSCNSFFSSGRMSLARLISGAGTCCAGMGQWHAGQERIRNPPYHHQVVWHFLESITFQPQSCVRFSQPRRQRNAPGNRAPGTALPHSHALAAAYRPCGGTGKGAPVRTVGAAGGASRAGSANGVSFATCGAAALTAAQHVDCRSGDSEEALTAASAIVLAVCVHRSAGARTRSYAARASRAGAQSAARFMVAINLERMSEGSSKQCAAWSLHQEG
jgi:hypothetical protein